MPYRLKPSNKRIIQVFKSGRWHDKYTHVSAEKARKQLYALKKNVKT
jgi:hypothetical protein